MAGDWFKIERQYLRDPLWLAESFTRGQAWLDLVGLACHKKGMFLKRGNMIHLLRGQCGWSIVALSDRWRWDRKKVRNFLNYLEKEQQIEQQNTNLTTIITIVNYDKYQYNGQQNGQQKQQQEDSRRTADGHIQEGREREECKNDSADDELPDSYDSPTINYKDFIQMFNTITGRNFRGDEKSRGQFNARIKEDFTHSDFEIAIKNCYKSKYHKENPNYLTPEFILRSDKLQVYLNYTTPVGNQQNNGFI